MASNFVSNAGLAMRGSNQAALDAETLSQQRQATQQGALGLEDLQGAAQYKTSQKEAMQSAQSMHDIAIAQAEAARQAGDSEGFQKYASQAMALPDQAEQLLVSSALKGVDSSQIESNVERLMGPNTLFDKGSLQIIRRGNNVFLSATKNGNPLPEVDATAQYAAQQKPTALSAGQVLVNPVTGKGIASNIQSEAAASGAGDIYMKTGPEAGKIKAKAGPKKTITTTRTSDGAQKTLPMFKEIAKSIAGHPDMATFDAYGNEILTPKGNEVASIANQIAQANRSLDPATIANIAVSGQPVVNQKTKQTAILYKGKYYLYSENQNPSEQMSEITKETVTGYAKGGKVNHKGIC